MNPSDPKPAYEPPRFEWDVWKDYALERGLDCELATLGRAVMREAIQHNWSEQLRGLSEGEGLSGLLFNAPDLGKRLCEVLLETDGLRIALEETDDPERIVIELDGFRF